MSLDYIKLRDTLARRLKDVPGILSVGLGRNKQQVVLLVAIDAKQFEGDLPKRFEGVDVILKDLGEAVHHLTQRTE